MNDVDMKNAADEAQVAMPADAADVLTPDQQAMSEAKGIGENVEKEEGMATLVDANAGDLLVPPPLQPSKKDRTLREFLPMMKDYAPIIPDAVTDYYLALGGFDCDDVRIKRLLALAAQKFMADLATDAYQYSKIRMATGGAQQNQAGITGGSSGRPRTERAKAGLTLEDLSAALAEGGLNIRRPEFYR